MKSKIVNWYDEGKKPVQPSPGFAKKSLSDHHLELMALCEYGCTYCSSNMGNFLRMKRPKIIETTQDQLGQVMLPETDPDFHIEYPDIIQYLRKQLEGKYSSYGEGQTIVASMLTDAFSPSLIQQGVTREALEILLNRTSFRIRVLTKNAAVGSPYWIDFFRSYPDRFVVGLSIGTLNNEWARRVEKLTSPPTKRAEATRRLQDAGIPTFGMLCPIFPTQYSRSPKLEELVGAIRPEYCEDVWAEPYNDRINWRHVRDGFEQESKDWHTINGMFSSDYDNGDRKGLWSEYATDLLLNIRHLAKREGWIDKLRFLLYEHDITQDDARRVRNLQGVMLQSIDETGKSKNPHFAIMQGV